MASKSDKQIQLIVGTIREDMELTTRSYSTRNHYGGNQVKCSVHKICAGASAGAGKVRVQVRRG